MGDPERLLPIELATRTEREMGRMERRRMKDGKCDKPG